MRATTVARQRLRGAASKMIAPPRRGRAWSPEELRDLASMCKEEGVLVASDEIWADWRHPGGQAVAGRAPSRARRRAPLSEAFLTFRQGRHVADRFFRGSALSWECFGTSLTESLQAFIAVRRTLV